ncbi:MAG: PHP domain-containing protein [Armatimonadota bacterium]
MDTVPCDIHCHTERSACAEDVTLDWYVQFARQNPDAVFAITDHSAQMFYPDDNPWGFWSDDAREIFEECRESGRRRIAQYITDIRAAQTGGMLVGIELDMFLDGTPVLDENQLEKFDVLLGAVHTYPGVRNEAPASEVIADYREFVHRLMGWGIHVLAHPFRILTDSGYVVSDDLIAWVVQMAAEHDVALEINSHKELMDADVRMATMAVEAGVVLAAGTDSHRLSEFGDFSYHSEIAQAVGQTPQSLYSCPTRRSATAAK